MQPVQKVLVFVVAGFQLHSLFGVFQSVYTVAKAAAGQGCIIIPAGAALTDGNGFQHVHGLGVMARIDIVSGGLHTGVLVRGLCAAAIPGTAVAIAAAEKGFKRVKAKAEGVVLLCAAVA